MRLFSVLHHELVDLGEGHHSIQLKSDHAPVQHVPRILQHHVISHHFLVSLVLMPKMKDIVVSICFLEDKLGAYNGVFDVKQG